jgi:hypothetical protein
MMYRTYTFIIPVNQIFISRIALGKICTLLWHSQEQSIDSYQEMGKMGNGVCYIKTLHANSEDGDSE